ncbi:MAG: ATP-dependent RecD-like DNA helicase [Deltaproteobacteria bacterium]|nr:ATP-dependent RecD-like DNA helicase [Deltaproteobacteria bacterium]
MPGLGGHSQSSSELTPLEGSIERVVYEDPESRFAVARLRVVKKPEAVTIVGHLLGMQAGSQVRLLGRWTVDKKYGEQFRVETCQQVVPATVAGIEKYLGSGLIPGIGPELAKRIVSFFGTATLEVIENQPDRLTEVEGIGRVRASRIQKGLTEHKELQEVMVFLQGHGVSPSQAVRIYKQYGKAAISLVRENPYRLALDVWGIGFKTADAIARKLGIDKASPARAEAGILHQLGELAEEGHVHVPEHELVAQVERELDIDPAMARGAVERLAPTGRVVREVLGERGECLSLRALWDAEVRAAASLARLIENPAPPVAISVDKAIAWFEKEQQVELAAQQKEAIRATIQEKVVVITGGPGVGKTTIVNAILCILAKKGCRVALAAPTGRAAKRLAEATSRTAMTLHRLLEFNPRGGRFERNEASPLDVDMVVVDEASMVDVLLAASLLAAIPSHAKVVLVGDVDQLPSVGPGRVLADVIASRAVTVVQLTEVFRQAAQSAIVTNAHRIHRGELPNVATGETASDFYFIERDEPKDVLNVLLALLAERIPKRFGLDPARDVQVLTPMHRGDVGSQNLNRALQARLNPPRPGVAELTRGQRVFRVGDKVMQVRNDYDKEVFNGDIGLVTDVVKDDEGEQVVVELDGRQVPYAVDELDCLVHAYAVTVHKSQGSEYPAVVIPVVTQHFLLLQRNLLYTAVTRGKKLVVLVGSRKALGIAVRTDDTRLRWTWLAARLREACSPQK